ncbi:MAG: ORF6N domain-containing protein [bacterium]|nr:ORF6N domain-containing protein [bacterium]
MDNKNEIAVFNQDNIKNKIYTIRGLQVMLDRDLAELYDVKTKVFNQAVKRNIERFPAAYMFQLTDIEKQELVTNCDQLNILKHSSVNPYVFTEYGVVNLPSVLRSKKAIEINIQIINTFIEMRRFLNANAQLFQRLNNVERKQIEADHKFDKIFDALENKNDLPRKGIFFDGQVFDAYKFVADIVRKAQKSIIVIDNFVDDRTFMLLSKRNKDVKVIIYTKFISRQLRLDLKKYNAQYPRIELQEFKHSHDRFIILDNKEVYHFGSSLKDLGGKWVAFSKFDKEAFKLMERLEK